MIAGAHPLKPLEATARAIWEERADLREEFQSISSVGFWAWLMIEGPKSYPRILEDLPVPPKELRSRVATTDVPGFIYGSLLDAQQLLESLCQAGFDPERGGALLDYGCGCGRILRMTARFAQTCELHGADVDAEAIAWCRANLAFARYETIPTRPPTRYPDGRFDALFSFSVFTHLPEPLHRAWLEELHRILRPGAPLTLTVLGRRAAERFLARNVAPELETPSPAEMRAGLPELERRGFVYYPIPRPYSALPEADRDADVFGMTFIRERYIRAHWLDLFEFLGLREAPNDWQDYVILRRR